MKIKKIVIICVGFVIMLLACASFVIWSRCAAKHIASILLRKDKRIGQTRLCKEWPIHWHITVESLWQNDPFHKEDEIADRWLLCITLTGNRLLATPTNLSGEQTAQTLEDARMQCVYQRGDNWVVVKRKD